MSEPISPSPTVDEQPSDTADGQTTETTGQDLVVEDLLVEEVSIDGMCGVY